MRSDDKVDKAQRERDDCEHERESHGPAARRAIAEEEAVRRTEGTAGAEVE